MIKMEELMKKYPKEVLEPFDDEEESNEVSLFFGTSIGNGYYYDLFYVNKLYDENKTFYGETDDLSNFKEAFDEFGEKFVYFDSAMLKKDVLKYISLRFKNGSVFSSIKEKIIADALVENVLDDEEEEDYDLSERDMFDVIVEDSDLLKMIKKAFVFNQEKFDQTDAKKNMIDTYRRIKSFIDDEIKDATLEKDESRIKELKEYLKFFDKLLLTRIYKPKNVILTDDYLEHSVEYKRDAIQVKNLIPDEIKMDIINKINMNVHISLDDVYNSIQDYHKDERFLDMLSYDTDEIFSYNEFVNNFVNACLSICKKEDGSRYTKEEILNYLKKKMSNFKRIRDKEFDSYLYEAQYDDSYSYNECDTYDEDYYYNGYKKER